MTTIARDFVSLKDFDLDNDPISTFQKLRQRGPVLKAKMPILGKCWISTTYEAADTILRDKERFCTDAFNAGLRSRTAMLGIMSWFMPKAVKSMMQNMLTLDEPDHRRLRSLVEAAFARQSVDSMKPAIERIVGRHLDLMESSAGSNGVVDFQNTFARRVPLTVICELLGLPDNDRPKFEKWCDFGRANSPLGVLRAMRGMGKLRRYLLTQFDECRKRPRPGMMSALVQAEKDGDRLTQEELFAAVALLFLAGHETTTHLISVGLLALEQHPQEKAKLVADWSRIDAAVDEMLRYNSTIQTTKPRYVRQDMEFYGHQIKRGELFMPMLAGANYDPAVFPAPDRFDIGRTNNHHMAFGRGIHVCLGLKLAKVEAGIAFKQLLTRFPNLEIATDVKNLKWNKRIGTRSLQELPIQLNNIR